MRGETQLPRTNELSFYEGTLDAPRIKTFWRTRCCRPRKSGLETKRKGGNSNKIRRLCYTAKSTTDWLEQHEVGVVEGWPTKGDDIDPIESLWARDLRTKSSRQRKE